MGRRTKERVVAVGIAATAVLVGSGCGASRVVGDMATPPTLVSAAGTCKVGSGQTRPLIVEWPAADRAALETKSKQGLVVVRYAGCEMEVLSQCRVKGTYAYTPVTPKHEQVVIRNADELFANIPAFAMKFEGKMHEAGQLTVNMTIVGTYQADHGTFSNEQLEGDCARATHVATGLTAGAFEFFAGADAEVGAGISAFGAGAGGRSAATKETLNQDGLVQVCATAKADDPAPPFNCGALVRLEVAPIDGVTPPRVIVPIGPPTRPESAPAQPSRAQRTIGLAVAGGGIAALGAGIFFGLQAKSKHDDAAALCDAQNACTREGLSLQSDARTSATVATAGFITGGIALVAGGVLFLTAPTSPVQVGMTATGIRIGGAF